jgi:hypothetical protein
MFIRRHNDVFVAHSPLIVGYRWAGPNKRAIAPGLIDVAVNQNLIEHGFLVVLFDESSGCRHRLIQGEIAELLAKDYNAIHRHAYQEPFMFEFHVGLTDPFGSPYTGGEIKIVECRMTDAV